MLGDKQTALRYVMVFSVVVNCNGYTDPEESENKKRRKKWGGVGITVTRRSPTRSLKQDSEACGGGWLCPMLVNIYLHKYQIWNEKKR